MHNKIIGLKNGYLILGRSGTTIDFIGYDDYRLGFFKNGERHREDGPAVFYTKHHARPEWWLNDEFYTSLVKYLKDLKKIRPRTPEEIEHIKKQWAITGWKG